MALLEIDKTALGHLTDAIRLGLDDLREETITRAANAVGYAKNGAQTYAHLRRLRTYLQRFVGLSCETAELDLSDDDQNLIAACALHEIGKLDRAIPDATRRDPNEGERLEGRRQSLATWCVRLATRRIDALSAAGARQQSLTVQAVQRDVQHRLSSNPDGDGLALVRDLSTDLHSVPALVGRSGASPPPPSAPSGSPHRPAPPVRPAPPQVDPVAAARLHAGVSPVAPQMHPELPPALLRPAGVLGFDVRHILDPRLRSMLQLDIAAYGRAVDAGDDRLGMAHLGSIVEGAALDFAFADRQRCVLGGAPETWNIEAVLNRLLENHFTPVNPNAIRFLVLARNILRPALQLSTAGSITPGIRAEFEEFAYRVLTAVAAAREVG